MGREREWGEGKESFTTCLSELQNFILLFSKSTIITSVSNYYSFSNAINFLFYGANSLASYSLPLRSGHCPSLFRRLALDLACAGTTVGATLLLAPVLRWAEGDLVAWAKLSLAGLPKSSSPKASLTAFTVLRAELALPWGRFLSASTPPPPRLLLG